MATMSPMSVCTALLGALITATVAAFSTAVSWLFSPLRDTYAPDAKFSLELDAALRADALPPPKRLPSWAAFRAFIERRREHDERLGGGFLPEGMFA